MSTRDATSTVRIGLVLPEVLGTYGDGGNALVLRERLRRRGYAAEIIATGFGEPVPETLDVYTLGGGEDSAQALAIRHMRTHPGLQRAASRGAPVLAVCAGLQILGERLTSPGHTRSSGGTGGAIDGLGLLDATTAADAPERITGEVAAAPSPHVPGLTDTLTGFADHAGRTILGSQARPLGTVTRGVGNGGTGGEGEEGAAQEGALQDSVVATYLHGPVLARNPQLADVLIARTLGIDPDALPPLAMPEVDRLRAERLAAR